MVVEPKIRGFICTTAHPKGCAKNVENQIDFVKGKGPIAAPLKKVLVLGSSTGYGLASRITAAFGCGAHTLGLAFEKAPEKGRTASPGFYQNLAFEREAQKAGLYCKTLNGDAFSDAMKKETLDLLEKDLGPVDLVVYSLAAPRRIHPKTGETYKSTLKPIGAGYTNKTIDTQTGLVTAVTLEPASEEDVEHTVQVMGGEDWQMWIEALLDRNLLAKGALTVAYSYIGPEVTRPIYRNGTIGAAKDHLEKSAHALNSLLGPIGGKAFTSVNKALVTQASSAIPFIPLYINLLYKVMKEKGIHEGCIEQVDRLFRDKLYKNPVPVDGQGRIRMDEWEMREDVQREVEALWEKVTTENVADIGDLSGYREDFLRLFGFGLPGVDYAEDVELDKV